MSDNDSSDLSSAPSDIEKDLKLEKKNGILKFFAPAKQMASKKRSESPEPPPREPSPPHEFVMADNPDLAFIVMFRSRFNEAFPKSLANFGPQELERGIVASEPAEHVEAFLCALLGLLLNRKTDVKSGHYNRALEEAIQTHKAQWARDWETKNPLSGGRTFNSMTPSQRLTLLRTLILWSLSSSQSIRDIITANYKQSRQEDDLNQPLSVQPWGSDSHRKKYYLIQGLDDTNFRVYREGGGVKEKTWWSVAGELQELKNLSQKLSAQDGGQKARVLAMKMTNALPHFEATEEKRRRREYRQARKQQFKRPEPGFSMYEGRTRGKRIRYTYSDEEEDAYSDTTSRRSTRNTGTHTPAEGPTITQSGRQIKPRHGGMYGEIAVSVDNEGTDATHDDDSIGGRLRRTATANGRAGKRSHEAANSIDDMEEESDASEQDYGDDEGEDDIPMDTDKDEADEISNEDEGENEDEDEDEQKIAQSKPSLVVKLGKKTPSPDGKTTLRIKLNGSAQKPAVSAPFGTVEESSLSNGFTNGNSTAAERSLEGSRPTKSEPDVVQAVSPTTLMDEAVPGMVSLPVAPDITKKIQEHNSPRVQNGHHELNKVTGLSPHVYHKSPVQTATAL